MNWQTLAGWALFVAASGWLSVTNVGFNQDEAWSLQVVWRMQTGATLYRDIFCGVLPLAFYLTLGLTKLLGAEVLVIKLSVVLCLALSGWTAERILQQLTGTERYRWFLRGLILIFALPRATALYQPLATLWLLLSAQAALAYWQAEALPLRARRNLLAAAGWVGCCLATKHNVGVFALAALGLTLTLKHWERAAIAGQSVWTWLLAKRWLGEVVMVLAVSGSLVAFVLLPVGWSGGGAALLDYAFSNKRTYLALGGVTYFDGLRELGAALGALPTGEALLRVLAYAVFLLPPLNLCALAWWWWHSSGAARAQTLVWSAVSFAALLTLYPRADRIHLNYVALVWLIGLLAAWHHWQASRPARHVAWLSRAAAAGLALSGVLLLGTAARQVWSAQTVWLRWPHFRYQLLQRDEAARAQALRDRLQAAAAGEPVLLLLNGAGFYYLVTGLQNPTPYDYPLATAFGLRGEAETITALAAKRIRVVCLQRQTALAPARLEQYISEHLQAVEDLGECTLYRVRP